MFYEVPEDRSQMSAGELRTLALNIRKAALAALRAGADADEVAAQRQLAAAIDVEASDQAEIEAAEAAEAASDTGADDDDEAGDDEGGDDADGDTEASTTPGGLAVVEAVQAGTDIDTLADSTPGRGEPIRPDMILAVDNTNSAVRDGQPYASWGDFGMQLIERARTIAPTTHERIEVGRILPKYPAAKWLREKDPFHNLRVFNTLSQYDYDSTDDEVRAALCAPFTPYYNLACMNTTRRPVAASLPGFPAPRGGVTIYPSPSLSDVDGSAGIWTRDDDADDEATKNACATITCATSEEFAMYGVYWCITVKNMLALTFPELVAAYMNRGAANFARVGEIQLLDAMGSGVSTINTVALGYSAATRVATQVLQYLALYREQQRWDDVPMHGWAPRWLLAALQIDLARRNTRGGAWRLSSEAEVNAVFRDAGINMTWYLDDPVWGTPVPASLATGGNPSIGLLGTLAELPDEVDILVAPEGKYAMIDRAQLSIGVTGNNWYRDNASNARNELTYFFENYEGVVDTTSCDAHILHFEDLCYTGREIEAVEIDCDGTLAAA